MYIQYIGIYQDFENVIPQPLRAMSCMVMKHAGQEMNVNTNYRYVKYVKHKPFSVLTGTAPAVERIGTVGLDDSILTFGKSLKL